MSVEHVQFALDQATNVSGSELLVLISLAEWADADGKCWPSHESIAKRARVSRRQVIRLVQSLIQKGWISQDQRRQYSNIYQLRCDIAMADVTLNSDVTFGASDVTSRVLDVTSRALRCDIAVSPEPPIEPPVRTTTKNHQGGARKPKPMPANGPVQELVKAWYERAGGAPTSWGRAMGHGKTLVAAQVSECELMEVYDWLAADSWWQDKGFDLGTVVAQLEKFRQSKRIPKTAPKGRASPFAGIEEYERIVNGQHEPDSEEANVFETTGVVR